MQEGLYAKGDKPVSSSYASRDLQHSIPMGLLACIPGLVSQLESIQCPSCPAILENATFYQRHLRKHTEKRPFECVTCHQTFNRVSLLNRHEGKHAKPRFKCSNCSKQFYRTDSYAQHQGRCLAPIETVQSQAPPMGDEDLLPEQRVSPNTDVASASQMDTIGHKNRTIKREDQPMASTSAPVMPFQLSAASSDKSHLPTQETLEISTERSLFHHSDFDADEARLFFNIGRTASQTPIPSQSPGPTAPRSQRTDEASADSSKPLGNLHVSGNNESTRSPKSSMAQFILYQLYCNGTTLYSGLEETHGVMLRSGDCFLSLIQQVLSAHGRLSSRAGYDDNWIQPFEIRSPFWVARIHYLGSFDSQPENPLLGLMPISAISNDVQSCFYTPFGCSCWITDVAFIDLLREMTLAWETQE